MLVGTPEFFKNPILSYHTSYEIRGSGIAAFEATWATRL